MLSIAQWTRQEASSISELRSLDGRAFDSDLRAIHRFEAAFALKDVSRSVRCVEDQVVIASSSRDSIAIERKTR
jgi:hypothetical protein